MKLVLYNDFKLGVLKEDSVFDASAALPGITRPRDLIETLITEWDQVKPAIKAAIKGQTGVASSSVRFRAPVPQPSQLVCAAGNYLEPARPQRSDFNGFLKAVTSIIGQNDVVELPDAPASVFHFEPELAVVIKKKAAHLSTEEAMDYVFGYTQFIDASARGLPGGFFLGKSWHTFAPMGPALITADSVPNPNDLHLEFAVNGEVRQSFSTGDMARFIPEMLMEVTKVMALEPGDVVATGTHHESLTPIQGGDSLRMQIAGFGPALTVTVHDALGRTWEQPKKGH